jgi:hypothetical protein
MCHRKRLGGGGVVDAPKGRGWGRAQKGEELGLISGGWICTSREGAMTTHMDQGLSLAEDIPAKMVLFEAKASTVI